MATAGPALVTSVAVAAALLAVTVAMDPSLWSGWVRVPVPGRCEPCGNHASAWRPVAAGRRDRVVGLRSSVRQLNSEVHGPHPAVPLQLNMSVSPQPHVGVTLMPQPWRDVVGGTIALLGTLLTLVMHQVLYDPTGPLSREYALSGQVPANFSWGVAAILLAVGACVGYVVRSRALAAGAGLVLLQAGLTAYEINRFPTSHNMLPFDVLSWVVMAAPLVIGAYAGARLRRRHAAGAASG